jgi:hypothetical protein
MIQDHKFLKPFSLHTNSATLFLVVRIGNELFFLTYAFPSKKRKDFNRCLIIWSLVAGPDRGRAVNVTAKLIQIQTAPEIKHTCHVSLSLGEQQRRRLSPPPPPATRRFGGDGAGGGGGGGGAVVLVAVERDGRGAAGGDLGDDPAHQPCAKNEGRVFTSVDEGFRSFLGD